MFWTAAFLLGLLGSLHCGAMCGPIALAITSKQRHNFTFFISQFSYNIGRIISYLLIGAFVGLIGMGLNLAGLQQSLSILSGILVLLIYFGPRVSKNFNVFNILVLKTTATIKKNIGPFFKSQKALSKFMIGFFNGFLPCGLVYIAAAGAIATGEPTDAAIFMLLFGLGTVPMLFGISILHIFFFKKLNFNFNKAIPVLVATISILFVLRGMNLGIPYVSPQISAEQLTEQLVCE